MIDRTNPNGKIKTREISFPDYFTRKQIEWISYKFREKIYDREYEKVKFNDICNKIKKTIDDMCFKNQKASIFTSETVKEKYLNMFFNDFGIPNQQYRDEYQRKVKGMWDRIYFFKVGFPVKIKDSDRIGNISNYNVKTGEVIIDHNDGNITSIHESQVKVDKVFDLFE